MGDNTALVLTAFRDFSQVSATLEAAYSHLSAEVGSLSRQLEQTNLRLQAALAEKEQLSRHLRNILDSLDCGVLVADGQGRLTHHNQAASTLMRPTGAGALPESDQAPLTPQDFVASRPELTAVLDSDGPTRFESKSVGDNAGEGSLLVERHDLAGDASSDGGAVYVIRDVTELRRLEAQTQRMERLATMGEMALELAHEVRNPLGSIRLFASMLMSDEFLSEAGSRQLKQLEVGIKSLETVVSNMLAFGRQQPPNLLNVDLASLLLDVSSFLAPLTKQRGVRVKMKLEEDLPTAHLDRDQMRQALMNLWLNALNAMPSGGEIGIACSRALDRLRIRIEDTGPGLPPDVLERVFDPFFSTDQKGTGLGLAVASSIVKNHGGTIRATSKPPKGATFCIELPVSSEEPCAVKH